MRAIIVYLDFVQDTNGSLVSLINNAQEVKTLNGQDLRGQTVFEDNYCLFMLLLLLCTFFVQELQSSGQQQKFEQFTNICNTIIEEPEHR